MARSTGLAWPSRCDSLRGFHLFRTATLRGGSDPDSPSARPRGLALGAPGDCGDASRAVSRRASCPSALSSARDLDRPWLRCMAVADRACICPCRCARRLDVLRRTCNKPASAGSSKIGSARVAQESVRFSGISYVTFRALDVVLCIRDKVIAAPGTLDLLMFLFFFPTISAGPIDRYRRFLTDWRKKRTRAEFLGDLDGAVHRFFRGLFYKFIVAALIKQHWLEPAARSGSFGALLSYMYAYSFYLFFDFAGYSAFAISLSYLFGIHT